MEAKHITPDKHGRTAATAGFPYDQYDLDGLYKMLMWIEGYEAGSKKTVPGKDSLKSIYRLL